MPAMIAFAIVAGISYTAPYVNSHRSGPALEQGSPASETERLKASKILQLHIQLRSRSE
jgi:hypothetical protein